MNNIRLRLAPSPTGFVHIGNLRTALFGYLLAKNMGGKFILRIEDTDQKREVEGAVESLINILDWLGLEFDEGPHKGGDYGPYIQSQRLAIYQQYVEQLVEQGHAYYCFCAPERLDKMRAEQTANKQAPRYDRTCRNLSPEEIKTKIANGEKFVIRQKMPDSGEVVVHDELRGDIKFKAEDLEDHVLVKSNGVPTYQFASVVDDHLMQISHVTRGEEWLPSFPKNILLYQSFGWEVPKFIHLPLILNKGGGKLSKRQGDVFVEDYKAKGYLPEALINFCALLGWHPNENTVGAGLAPARSEIFSLKELAQEFNLEGLGVSPAVFDLEKLDYYNGYYIRQKSVEELTELCLPYLLNNPPSSAQADYGEAGTQHAQDKSVDKIMSIFDTETDLSYINKVVALEQERLVKLADIADKTIYFFKEPVYEADLLIWKNLSQDEIKDNLNELKSKIESLADFNDLEKDILAWLKESGKKNGDYLWPMRVALTGLKASPSPFEVATVIGKEETLKRLATASTK